jgi:hypothetical protein
MTILCENLRHKTSNTLDSSFYLVSDNIMSVNLTELCAKKQCM